MNDDEAYVYKDIAADAVRLLYLSKDGDEMTSKLSAFSIDKLPEYHALSYTWDGQIRDRNIECDRASLAVTSNIQIILPYLLQRYGNHYLWIDAVCINQDNVKEKNVQIPLMRTIYSKAVAVDVWLGVGDAIIHKAIKEVPAMLPKMSKFDGRLGLDDSRLSSQGLPVSSSPVWCGIHDLLSKSWFSRVWVFQEAVLSKRLEVLCGDQAIEANTLISFVQGLSSESMSGLTRGGQVEPGNVAVTRGMAMLQKISLYMRWRAIDQRFSFLTLVEIGRELSATKDVDKVYGLLGLAPDSLRVQLDIDTAKSPAEVYVEVAKYDIANEPILNILQLASSNQPLAGLPSWCPNFAGPRKTSTLGGHARGYHAGFEDRIYDSFPFQATISQTNNLLELRGSPLDEVTEVIEPGWSWIQSPEIAPNLAAASQTLVWENKCLKLSQQTYHSGSSDTVPEPHWRTLIANKLNEEKCVSDQQEAYALMRLSLAIVSAKARQPERAHEIGTTMTDAQARAVEDYMRAAQAACNGRCFFNTRDGRIGLGERGVKVRDLVYVVLNAWTPFILRPNKRVAATYRLIGEAYVHGLMSSEAFGIVDENAWESIYLE